MNWMNEIGFFLWFSQNFWRRLLFAVIIVAVFGFMYQTDEKRKATDSFKYHAVTTKKDRVLNDVSIAVIAIIILTLFIPQIASYWIILFVFPFSVICLIILLVINSNYSKIENKSENRIRNSKKVYEKHLNFMAKDCPKKIFSYIDEDNKEYRELAENKMDEVLRDYKRHVKAVDGLSYTSTHVLQYALRKVDEKNIKCQPKLRKLLINSNKDIRKKACKILSKQGETRWQQALADNYEISDLVNVNDPDAESLLVKALLNFETAKEVTLGLCKINSQNIEKYFVKALSATLIKKNDKETKEVFMKALVEYGDILLIKQIVKLINSHGGVDIDSIYNLGYLLTEKKREHKDKKIGSIVSKLLSGHALIDVIINRMMKDEGENAINADMLFEMYKNDYDVYISGKLLAIKEDERNKVFGKNTVILDSIQQKIIDSSSQKRPQAEREKIDKNYNEFDRGVMALAVGTAQGNSQMVRGAMTSIGIHLMLCSDKRSAISYMKAQIDEYDILQAHQKEFIKMQLDMQLGMM